MDAASTDLPGMPAAPTPLAGIGVNITAYRKARKCTQRGLAAAIGKSVPWVSAVEQGRRHAERLTDLVNIAAVLGCRVDDLIGRPMDHLAPGTGNHGEIVADVRSAIMRLAIPAFPTTSPPAVRDVRTRVAEAWAIWHRSPTAHTSLGEILPGLLTDATAAYSAAGPDERRDAAKDLAGAYQIARQWLHHIPDGELAWIAAERAVRAAREADDPHLMALGAWALSASYRRAGQQEEATRLCLTAADDLKPHIDTSNPQRPLLAAYGMLHLAGAISAAQSDEDNRAWAFHRVAEDAAASLGDHYDPWTVFGRGNVAIHGLSIRAELGHANDVVDYAAHLDIDEVPSVERRSRVLIDTARAYVQRNEDEAATLVLLDAEKVSADEVRHSTLARELVRELLLRDRARARPHVRGLASRVGLVAA